MTDTDLRAAMLRLAEEWGITRDDGDFSSDFAESIHENGAWRFARDFHAALAAHPAPDEAGEAGEWGHDEHCESEYETGAHAWTPCGCWASRSEAEGMLARAEKAEAKVESLREQVGAVEAATPNDCWVLGVPATGSTCTDMIGGGFKNGAKWAEDMCCLPCRIRAALATTEGSDR